MKQKFIFSLIKAVVISGFVFLGESFGLEDFFPLYIALAAALIFLGYREAIQADASVYKYIVHTSLIGSALLILNPMFWGASGGHPPVPNIIGLPIIFLFLLLSGWIGGLIYKKRNPVPLANL